MIASRLVEEFSHPHTILSEEDFIWDMPPAQPEPPRKFPTPTPDTNSDGKLLAASSGRNLGLPLCNRVPRLSRSASAPATRCGSGVSIGYNVLTFDFRGHGDSDSVITSGGYIEVLDLKAAITGQSFSRRRCPIKSSCMVFLWEPRRLLAPSHPAVAAIIADSPYASTGDVIQRIIKYRFQEETASWKPFFRWTHTVFPIVSWAIVKMCNVVSALRFGHPFIAHPVRSFKRLKKLAKTAQQPRHIPILLIYASGDQLIPIAHAHQIVARRT